MAGTGIHQITPKQLIILRYMTKRLSENPPVGWTDIRRMESQIRFAEIAPEHPRQPILEDLVGTHDGIFPLTGQRSEMAEPYLIVHQGQTSYRISQAGVDIAARCTLEQYTGPRGSDGNPAKLWRVIDKRTGKPPKIETTVEDATGAAQADDFEEDGEGGYSDNPPVVPTDEHGIGQDVTMHDEQGDDGDGRGRDEINDDPPPRGMRAQVTAPAEPKTSPSKKPPQVRKPTKARVPGRTE